MTDASTRCVKETSKTRNGSTRCVRKQHQTSTHTHTHYNRHPTGTFARMMLTSMHHTLRPLCCVLLWVNTFVNDNDLKQRRSLSRLTSTLNCNCLTEKGKPRFRIGVDKQKQRLCENPSLTFDEGVGRPTKSKGLKEFIGGQHESHGVGVHRLATTIPLLPSVSL